MKGKVDTTCMSIKYLGSWKHGAYNGFLVRSLTKVENANPKEENFELAKAFGCFVI